MQAWVHSRKFILYNDDGKIPTEKKKIKYTRS